MAGSFVSRRLVYQYLNVAGSPDEFTRFGINARQPTAKGSGAIPIVGNCPKANT